MPSNPFSDSMQLEVGGDASGARTALTSLMDTLAATETKVAALGGALAAVSAGGLAKGAKAFADFDAAMTESVAIMGDVSSAMEQDMADAARTVAQETTFSAEEAAESYFFLASAGMDAAESMEALPQVAKFAQAGMFDMAEATDILTDAQSALGDETLTLTDLSDKLVKANTMANASVEQFGTALTNKAAPAMSRLGVETEEGIAALAVFADQGLKGRRAGTILARTLEGLESNARKNAEAFEELGIEVTDANGEMRPMEAIIRDMEDAFAGMSTEQRQAALEQMGFNKRAMQGIDLLIGNSEALAEYEAGLDDAGGTTEEVANNQLDTFNNQLELLKSRIHDVFISIGENLAPAMTALVDVAIDAIDRFAAFNEATGGMAATVTLVAGLVTGLTVVLGTLVTTLGGTSAILGVVAAGFSALLSPITLVIAAVAALAVAWKQNLFGIRDITAEVMQRVRAIIEQAIAAIEAVWREHGPTITEVVRTAYELVRAFIAERLRAIQTLVTTVLAVITQLWAAHGDRVVEVVRAAYALIQQVVQAGLQVVQAVTREALAVIEEVWAIHGERITELTVQLFELIKQVTAEAHAAIQEFWRQHGQTIIEIVRTFYEVLTTITESFHAFLLAAWQAFGDELLAVVRFTFEAIRTVVTIAMDAILTAITVALAVIQGEWQVAWTAIKEFFERTMNAIISFAQAWGGRFIEWLTGVLERAFQAFVDFANRLIFGSLIRDMFNAILEAARTFGQQFVSVLTDVLNRALEVFTTWMDNVLSAFQSWTDSMMSAFQSFAGSLLSAARSMLNTLFGRFSGTFADILSTVRSSMASARSAFVSELRTMLSRAKSILSDIVSAFRSALSKVKSIASDIISTAKNAASRAASLLSSARSDASEAESVTSSGASRGFRHGGIVTGGAVQATLHGPEAVIPLNSRGARFLQQALGGDGGGRTIHIRELNVRADDAQALIDDIIAHTG